MRTRVLVVWALLGIAGPSHAARLGLAWDFPRDYAPAPDMFVLTVTQGGATPQQFRIQPAGEGACAALDPAAVRDTFCTLLACPTPGAVVAFWIQPSWGTTLGVASNIVTCWFKPADRGCVCRDPAEAVPALPPPPPLPPTQPPPTPVVVPPLVQTTPPLVTTVPPLPQQTAEGLNLLPLGGLPAVAVVPAIPSSAGT